MTQEPSMPLDVTNNQHELSMPQKSLKNETNI